MSNSQNELPWSPKALADLSHGNPVPLAARDRSTPIWAACLSVLFSFGAGACYVAIAVFSVFFLDLVAIQRQQILAYLLTFGALVPIVGILILRLAMPAHWSDIAIFGNAIPRSA